MSLFIDEQMNHDINDVFAYQALHHMAMFQANKHNNIGYALKLKLAAYENKSIPYSLTTPDCVEIAEAFIHS